MVCRGACGLFLMMMHLHLFLEMMHRDSGNVQEKAFRLARERTTPPTTRFFCHHRTHFLKDMQTVRIYRK
jgi:hypothetical protein